MGAGRVGDSEAGAAGDGHGRNGRRHTVGALLALNALNALRALLAGGTLLALNALFTLHARGALNALFALNTLNALRTARRLTGINAVDVPVLIVADGGGCGLAAVLAVHDVERVGAGRVGDGDAGTAGDGLGGDGWGEARLADRAGIALGAGFALRAPLTLRALKTLFALVALVTLVTLRSLRTLSAARTLAGVLAVDVPVAILTDGHINNDGAATTSLVNELSHLAIQPINLLRHGDAVAELHRDIDSYSTVKTHINLLNVEDVERIPIRIIHAHEEVVEDVPHAIHERLGAHERLHVQAIGIAVVRVGTLTGLGVGGVGGLLAVGRCVGRVLEVVVGGAALARGGRGTARRGVLGLGGGALARTARLGVAGARARAAIRDGSLGGLGARLLVSHRARGGLGTRLGGRDGSLGGVRGRPVVLHRAGLGLGEVVGAGLGLAVGGAVIGAGRVGLNGLGAANATRDLLSVRTYVLGIGVVAGVTRGVGSVGEVGAVGNIGKIGLRGIAKVRRAGRVSRAVVAAGVHRAVLGRLRAARGAGLRAVRLVAGLVGTTVHGLLSASLLVRDVVRLGVRGLPGLGGVGRLGVGLVVRDGGFSRLGIGLIILGGEVGGLGVRRVGARGFLGRVARLTGRGSGAVVGGARRAAGGFVGGLDRAGTGGVALAGLVGHLENVTDSGNLVRVSTLGVGNTVVAKDLLIEILKQQVQPRGRSNHLLKQRNLPRVERRQADFVLHVVERKRRDKDVSVLLIQK